MCLCVSLIINNSYELLTMNINITHNVNSNIHIYEHYICIAIVSPKTFALLSDILVSGVYKLRLQLR